MLKLLFLGKLLDMIKANLSNFLTHLGKKE